LGADLMAISPELPDNTLTMAEKHAIPIDILSDTTSEVLKKYRRAGQADPDYSVRMEPAEIAAAILRIA